MQYSYSMLRLPSALRAVKACGPPCESTSKIVGLGPQISLNFTEVIQAYAIFTILRDASFRFRVSDRNRTGYRSLIRQLLYQMSC